MKILNLFIILVLSFTSLSLLCCSKSVEPGFQTTDLEITVVDEVLNKVQGAKVTLRESFLVPATHPPLFTDMNGKVLFSNVNTRVTWIAEKGCKSNRSSIYWFQQIINPNSLNKATTTIEKTGILKVVNSSNVTYSISPGSSYLPADSTLISYFKEGQILISAWQSNTPGSGRDTLLNISCGDTTRLNVPF